MSEEASTMWRSMPVSFGPGAAKDRYRAVMRAITIPYLTEAEPLARLLPRYYRLAGRPVVRVSHRHVSGVDVLAGGSYNMVGVSVDVTFVGERDDGESATGSFLLVGWKDHPAPVLTGREYSGQAELVGRLGDAVPSDDGSWSFLCSDFSGGALLRGEATDLIPVDGDALAAMNDAATGSVTFGWKYIPSAGGSGADVDCPTTSASSTHIARAWIGCGEVQYLSPRLEEAPMSFHIMEGLRALPAVEQLPAMLIEGTAEAVRAGGRRLPWSE